MVTLQHFKTKYGILLTLFMLNDAPRVKFMVCQKQGNFKVEFESDSILSCADYLKSQGAHVVDKHGLKI